MAHAVTSSTAGTTAAKPRAQFENKFLLRLANFELAPKHQFSLGVLLELEPAAIRAMIKDSEDAAATNTFALLESWRSNWKTVGNYTASYDQLCEAFLELKRGDIAEFIRREQVRCLKEQLHKAKEENQRRVQFNEQIRDAREELRKEREDFESTKRTYDEQIRLAREEARNAKEELKTYKEKHEAVAALKVAAQPAEEESSEDSKRRKLRVISLLRQSQDPALWGTVSQHILTNGELNISGVTLDVQQVKDMTYLLASCAGSTISILNLTSCRLPTGTGDEVADMLEAAGRLLELTELSLFDNDLRGRPMSAVADNIDHWPRLRLLNLDQCNLDDTDVGRLVTTLSSATSLKELWLAFNSINDDTARRVTETAVTLPTLQTLSLYNNWLSKAGVARLRDAVRQTPRVWLVGVDCQRPQGQGLVHPDPVVHNQRRVDQLQSTLTRLQARPLAARDQWWGDDVAWLQGWLDMYQDRLREAQAE